MKKILLILILFLPVLVSASIVSFNFNPEINSSQNSIGIIYSNSIVFQVITTSPVLCRYSQISTTPFSSMEGIFDDNFETIHKKTMTELHDGIYKYYVKCRPIDDINNASTGLASLEATLKISNPISAQITIDNSPLKAGKHEISLVTTKFPASTPQLKYSYDGITYSPIMLYGSGNSWKGFLVISPTAGEEVGSFKFEARDLEGRVGTQISGDSIFEVDTKKPSLITSLEASGEYGQIKLKWILNEDEKIKKIKVYRSENPNIDLTNLYKTINEKKEKYYDTDVKNGKTYYYRISSEDEAGNKADLSREISATGLLFKTSTKSEPTGLSSSLIGSVDAVISEIELLETDIKNSDNMIANLESTKREYMEDFKIINKFKNSKSELTSLKKTVENYKLTDMTKDVLDSRLDSARIKIKILKKKIPSSFETIDSIEINSNPTEDSIRKTVLEYSPELSPSMIDKTVKKSLQTTTEENLQIKSKLGVFHVIYLDGTSEDYSIVEHSLTSELKNSSTSKFLLRFPSGSLDISSLLIKNIDYTIEQEGLISFGTGTKKITYTFNQKLEPQILSEISLSLIIPQKESIPLTGYFLSSIPSQGSTLATFLIILASGLIGYLLFIKQQQRKEVSLDFLKKAKQVKVLQKQNKIKEAGFLYDQLKVDYLGLSNEQKHEVFKEIKHLTKK